jgi:hypothetical protein
MKAGDKLYVRLSSGEIVEAEYEDWAYSKWHWVKLEGYKSKLCRGHNPVNYWECRIVATNPELRKRALEGNL